MNKKPLRILMLCDYVVPTGFGIVGENIVKNLRTHFGDRLFMDIVAINYHGEKFTQGKQINVFSAMALSNKKQPDYFGRDGFASMLKMGNYDFVYVINDIGVVGSLLELIKLIKRDRKAIGAKDFKTIVYFPMDGKPFKEWFDHTDVCDEIVTYTHWAKREIVALRPDLKNKIEVIYHGNNPDNFFPIHSDEDRQEFREAYFGKNHDKTIFANINRNQPRKDIPATMTAFVQYLENYDKNAFLYLHMNPHDELGWKLDQVARQLGLVQYENFMFTSPDLIKDQPDQKFMNCIYNACDFYITTTSGEGWGLGITEAMAAGIPVIAANNSAITEITGDGSRAYLTDRSLHRPYITHFDNMVREQVDIDNFADLMHEAATSPGKNRRFAENGLQFVNSISWQRVCDQWIKLFEKNL